MNPSLTVTKDFTRDFMEVVKRFKHDQIVVGIPAEDDSRDGVSAVGNAQILAMNHFGSPANNVPPRPVLEIGIRRAQKDIAEEFRKAAINALSRGFSELDKAYNRAGSIAAQSCKKVINEQIEIDPPAESTIAARESMGFSGDKALLVTGQTRNAITYVIRGR